MFSLFYKLKEKQFFEFLFSWVFFYRGGEANAAFTTEARYSKIYFPPFTRVPSSYSLDNHNPALPPPIPERTMMLWPWGMKIIRSHTPIPPINLRRGRGRRRGRWRNRRGKIVRRSEMKSSLSLGV